MISEGNLSCGPAEQMGEGRVLNQKSLHPANATDTTIINDFPDIFAVYVLDLTAKDAKGKHKRRSYFLSARKKDLGVVDGFSSFRICVLFTCGVAALSCISRYPVCF